ncbi:Protein kinase C delta type [Mycena kentingensis (nom. inval.)]|nr:Protein kinase C delta type [Mycena kentingensis (nom. inval.)]
MALDDRPRIRKRTISRPRRLVSREGRARVINKEGAEAHPYASGEPEQSLRLPPTLRAMFAHLQLVPLACCLLEADSDSGAAVYAVRLRLPTERAVTVKTYADPCDDAFAAEMRVLRKLRRWPHPRLQQLFTITDGLWVGDAGAGFVTHFYACKLRAMAGVAPPTRLWTALYGTVAYEIASAFLHLHSLGIVHREISPATVFIDHSGHCILGSFTSASTYPAHLLSSFTPTDCWCLGITLLDLLTNFASSAEIWRQLALAQPGGMQRVLQERTACPEDIVALILQLCDVEPGKRLYGEGLLQRLVELGARTTEPPFIIEQARVSGSSNSRWSSFGSQEKQPPIEKAAEHSIVPASPPPTNLPKRLRALAPTDNLESDSRSVAPSFIHDPCDNADPLASMYVLVRGVYYDPPPPPIFDPVLIDPTSLHLHLLSRPCRPRSADTVLPDIWSREMHLTPEGKPALRKTGGRLFELPSRKEVRAAQSKMELDMAQVWRMLKIPRGWTSYH